MAKLMFGKGKTRVVMDDVFARLHRNAMERLAPGVLPALEQARTRIFKSAQDRWPVKTGFSKSQLAETLVLSPNQDIIRASVYNFAKYAKYIKGKKLGGKSAFVELLRKPLKAEVKRLLVELPGDAVRALRGR